MPKRKPTIDDFIEAIIARDEGMPYPEVLETFELTPNQFARAAKEHGSFIHFIEGRGRKVLEALSSDPKRRRELFNMGEEFVKQQYDRIQGKIPGEKQSIFHEGTLVHPENINALVYYALRFHNQELISDERIKKATMGWPSSS